MISMKTFFQEHFQEHEDFLKNLKQVFRVHFPDFFTYLFSIKNQLLINIYYLQY